MKFLFSHRNFPAQFKHIIKELGKNPENEVVFLTRARNDECVTGVRKIIYKPKRKVPENCHSYLRQYEEAVIHGQAAGGVAISLRDSGFVPDVIFAHAWGNSLFFKEIYPDVPLINYCEWYYNWKNSDADFEGVQLNDNQRAFIKSKNAGMLLDLVSCDAAVCPTEWQKLQFPEIFSNKIKVIHDGIDADYFAPDCSVEFKLESGRILCAKDEVLTYATRGMEPYRGFPQFMRACEKLLNKRKDLQVVVAGEDRVCYGQKGCSYKEKMLKELNIDISRVHFTGKLPYDEYKKLLQISSAHVYLTYPFILSWSLLEAMSCGCAIIGSKTPPVEEVIIDGDNGLLCKFFDVDDLSCKIEFALDNPEKMQKIRENARNTILEKYDIKHTLPEILDLLYSTAGK